MDEHTTQILERLTAAAEALENAVARLDAQHEALNAKVERIVAAIDEGLAVRADSGADAKQLQARVAELEQANNELKAQAARLTRKTLPPLVSSATTEPVWSAPDGAACRQHQDGALDRVAVVDERGAHRQHVVIDGREVGEDAVDRMFAWFREVDERFSTYRRDSEIERINRGELALADADSSRLGAKTYAA